MINSINFPADEPNYCYGYLGSSNLHLSQMLHSVVPMPLSYHFLSKDIPEYAISELLNH
jgi:hypothetical protein